LGGFDGFADPQGRFGDRDRWVSIYVVETASATMKIGYFELAFIPRDKRVHRYR
jgi:hypothetical protein